MSAWEYGDTSKYRIKNDPNLDKILNKYPQAVNQKSVSDGEKREKLIVIKKLEGLEKELKVEKVINWLNFWLRQALKKC